MKAKRLKKGPELADYVLEISFGPTAARVHDFFDKRADARTQAKIELKRGATRIRIFHIKYSLVQDKKAAK